MRPSVTLSIRMGSNWYLLLTCICNNVHIAGMYICDSTLSYVLYKGI